ncbi:hypothetical protein BN946_scf185033.g15 [Trametes cinnabarina]|uniref:Uncharacterized protein n=1 Tax=Pycnoporus cinnabarinus TaxID=5643 RepID=A0A060SWH0_PYCCI|nr:hypothetical protein BN946_scf185033.g15 [Trametes cinnabarina]
MAAPPVPPVNFAQMGPNFGPAGFPPQAVANQGYAFHNIAPHNVGITPQVSTSEYNEAKLVWDRLSSSERERLVHLYAGQQASSDPSASPRVDPLPSQPPSHPNHARSVSPESEGIAMHIDNEHVTASSSKLDKGKAPQASSDVPIQEDFNGMTTDFGYMLLNKLQESHNHTENLLADFMKKQCELQAQLCNTVVRALRGAPVDSAGSESPLPLHTHRRTPQKPAKPRTAQSPATPTETGKRAGRKSNIIAPGADCPDAALTALQVAVRTHLKTLLGYTSWQDLVRRYPPLTEEEIEGYGVDSDSVPSPDVKFRVDFVHDWKRLPLNLAARDHLVQTLHGTIKGGGFGFAPDVIPLITHVHISSALDVHMEYCRRKYREHCQPDGDSDDDETKAKRKADATARKKRNAMNSRKATLLESRAYVVTNLGLSRHALLLDKLLPQNMSSDETDDPKSAHKRYRIIDAQWQSTAIKAFLRRLDGIYLEYCATRGGGGSRPRERVLAPNRKSEDSHAPEGLWRNCYDPAWLASRQAYQIRRLRIIDSDYDFSIDPAEDDVAMNSEDEVEEEL